MAIADSSQCIGGAATLVGGCSSRANCEASIRLAIAGS